MTIDRNVDQTRARARARYPLLRPEDEAAAKAFTTVLGGLLQGPGQSLSARDLARRGHMGQSAAGQITKHQVAMPFEAFLAVLDYLSGRVDPDALIELLERYEQAYAVLFPGFPADLLLQRREALHARVLEQGQQGDGQDTGAADVAEAVPVSGVERLSRLARAEAGRLVETAPEDVAAPLGELYVPRSVEAGVLGRCRRRGVTVVRGEPGVGKTSLLWHLAETLDPTPADARARTSMPGRPFCLFVRAVDLVPGRAGPEQPGRVGIEDLGDALAEARPETPAVVLVDTVDLLLRSEQGKALLLDLLARVAQWPVSMVLTCRDQEYRELAKVQQEFPHSAQGLDVYDSEELDAALESHARHFLAGAPVDPTQLREQIARAATRGLPLPASSGDP